MNQMSKREHKTEIKKALLSEKRTQQRQRHRDTEIGNAFIKSILLGLLTGPGVGQRKRKITSF